jgi:hypothetical protein
VPLPSGVAGFVIFLDLCTGVVSETGFISLSVNIFDFAKLFRRCMTFLSSLRGIGFGSSKLELQLGLYPEYLLFSYRNSSGEAERDCSGLASSLSFGLAPYQHIDSLDHL